MVSPASVPMEVGAGAARLAGAAAAGGGKRVAQARGCNAGSSQELLVIETDDLRAALGLQVALEIRRDIDCRDRFTGSDILCGRRQRTGAVDDFQVRRRRDVFHQGTRSVRPVLVDDRHPKPSDDRMAEDGRQYHEPKERHAEDQKQRHTIVKQPAALAPRDPQKSGL